MKLSPVNDVNAIFRFLWWTALRTTSRFVAWHTVFHFARLATPDTASSMGTWHVTYAAKVCVSSSTFKLMSICLFWSYSKPSNQGYMDNYCFHAGSCGERDCPSFCLCLEASLCVGPSMSSSRISMMDQYRLRPDPCDNRIIRLTNCLQILSW